MLHVGCCFQEAYTHIPQHMWTKFTNNEQSHHVPDRETGLRKVIEEDVAFIEDANVLMMALTNDTETELMKDTFAEPLSFVVRNNFPYYNLFSRE